MISHTCLCVRIYVCSGAYGHGTLCFLVLQPARYCKNGPHISVCGTCVYTNRTYHTKCVFVCVCLCVHMGMALRLHACATTYNRMQHSRAVNRCFGECVYHVQASAGMFLEFSLNISQKITWSINHVLKNVNPTLCGRLETRSSRAVMFVR
jgi:hypothetical protein